MKKENTTPQQERAKEVLQDNKIVRWVKAGFPPIDLNENVSAIVELSNNYTKLLELLTEIKDHVELNKAHEIDRAWIIGTIQKTLNTKELNK